MRITGREWLALTLGEKISALEFAEYQTFKRWQK